MNFNSNLAILTGCETGKPVFQTGEYMISLAHTFNFARNGSILTSLWKIDEKTSSEILKLFYNNIKNGLPKDKALHLAKLIFKKKNEGRLLTPCYWSGSILMGNIAPIALNSYKNLFIYTSIIVSISLILSILILKRKK
ncbi:CHAT domain-containing protein [Tamlana sp. 62-3]|uniref:CHAT domain-containing protein n=1 Tax=Neotamlana sargassicola TaxID=2883125 RepID=A0A9X1L8I4_9FLAO|nr:CHAT domain-containing protein [Tamlana sargassicola]MCB4809539.1 CHAT domain-containing protein [Tamlana sargassicola]